MYPRDEEKERRDAWSALKAAVHDYAVDPSDSNSAEVRRALLRIRTVRERLLAARISGSLRTAGRYEAHRPRQR